MILKTDKIEILFKCAPLPLKLNNYNFTFFVSLYLNTMDSDMMSSSVWDDNVPQESSYSYNHFSRGDDQPWGADSLSKNINDDGDNDNDIDEFKIQNELAHTMNSIFLDNKKDEKEEEDEDEDENEEHEHRANGEYQDDSGVDDVHGNSNHSEHVHYNDTHRKSDVGNPFLAGSESVKDNDHIDIQMLKEKKNQLLNSLTSGDNAEKSFLKDSNDDLDKSVNELFLKSPQKPSGNSQLDNLLSEPESAPASETETETKKNDEHGEVADTEKEKENEEEKEKEKKLLSPIRKVNVIRPRRVMKHNLHSSEPSSAVVASASPLEDPLSAPALPDDRNDSSLNRLSSPTTRKQKFINEAEAPLFEIKRANLNVNETTVDHSLNIDANYKPKDEKVEDFDITVGDPLKVGELTNAHVVYTITTNTKSTLMNHETTVVTRRYNDFLWLYHQLLNNHPGYIIPPPPEKQVYGRFDDKFIESRRLALENMLKKISKRNVFQNDLDFILFLQSENFSEESKQKEAIVYHDDENKIQSENSDDLINGPMNTMAQILNATASLGINDGSSSGGFFSSLIGLNVPKYVETDNYILEKQSYIDSLDEQLRQLTQVLDMILEKREELSLSLNDVSAVLLQLSDLEVNSEITEILSNFEELQVKIKELLERGNLSQIFTFGATVDEYILLIGSIRNCFENRLKVCNSVATLQKHKEKKEHNLAKFKAKNQNQTDKIHFYEEELKKLNDVVGKQIKLKDNFEKIFKDELSRFEFDKIKDFKNMIEIYWESLIENQKILIELWESFYEKCKFD